VWTKRGPVKMARLPQRRRRGSGVLPGVCGARVRRV